MKKGKKRLIRKGIFVFLSFIVSVLLVAIFIWLVSAGAMSFTGEISHNIFEFKTIGDGLLVGLMTISIIFTIVYLSRFVKCQHERMIKPFAIIVSVFNIEMLIMSLIPLSVLGLSISVDNVSKVINNTKIFYYSTLVIMLIGVIAMIFLLKDYLVKNNWWFFLIAMPHIMIGWVIQTDYKGFHSFINLSDFSYKKVSEMLENMDMDLLMFNPTWFKCMAVMILVLIILIGMIIYEFIWEKTKSWRK